MRTEGDLEPANDSGATSTGGGGSPRAGYGYAICYRCGRAEPESGHPKAGGTSPLPPALKKHRRLRGYRACGAQDHYWRHMALAGGVRTETLRLQLRGPAEPTPDTARRFGLTWLVALQLAAGEVLGIDSRSIGGLLEPRPGALGVAFDAILYDQVAGGAGHCRALLTRWPELIDAVRRRLDCSNPQCTHGCHRCLIAYETQRHEANLRRSELAAFLSNKWDTLKERAVRDGVPVSPLFRGGADVRERLARAPKSRVIVTVPWMADGALSEDGWLRTLIRHADRGGHVDLVVSEAPDPNDDAGRFVAERLRLAMGDGRFNIRKAAADTVNAFNWRLVFPDTGSALFVDPAGAETFLAADWLGAGVLEADAVDAAALATRAEALVSKSATVSMAELTPPPPAPTIAVHTVPEGAPPAHATFAHWLRGPNAASLFDRPLAELTIIDPYLATEWQLTLLAEIVALAKSASCTNFRVETYPPEPEKEGSGPGVHRTVIASEQRQILEKMLGVSNWQAQPDPGRGKRKHKRLLIGKRRDGTQFEVLLERGIDFIVEKRVAGKFQRTTRETFLTVRDPA